MNINILRNAVYKLHGKEYLFSQNIKRLLPVTNFELIGEELYTKDICPQGITGKCDLWLANVSNNFLLSVELKVGSNKNSSKQQILREQTLKYTDMMKYHFPGNVVYGLGVYKFLNTNDIKYFNNWDVINSNHQNEINILKSIMYNYT